MGCAVQNLSHGIEVSWHGLSLVLVASAVLVVPNRIERRTKQDKAEAILAQCPAKGEEAIDEDKYH